LVNFQDWCDWNNIFLLIPQMVCSHKLSTSTRKIERGTLSYTRQPFMEILAQWGIFWHIL
jgi:hypothetical protein